MKKILVLATLLLLVPLGVLFAFNSLVQWGLESGMKAVTGVELAITRLKLNPFAGQIQAWDLRLFNPPGFEERVMLEAPELYLLVDIPEWFREKSFRIRELRLHLARFEVVKNRDGRLNLASLKTVRKKEAQPKEPPKPRPEGKRASFRMDRLVLRIDHVAYRDYSKSPLKIQKEFAVNLQAEYENLTNISAVINTILLQALKSTTIGQLANFDLESLSGAVDAVWKSGQQFATGAKAKAQTVLEKAEMSPELAAKTGAAVKDAAGAVTGAAGTLTGRAGGFFGALKSKVSEEEGATARPSTG